VGRLLRFARVLLLTIFTVTVAPASGAVAAGSSAVHHEYAYDAVPRVPTWHDTWTSAGLVLAHALGPTIENASYRLCVTSGGRVTTRSDFVATESDAPDFDTARKEAFVKASGPGWEENPDIKPTKWDPKTGTAVEFKGPGGAKVGYDGPHPETPGEHHDTQHISWQSAGKRGAGGSRGNIPYSGPRGPVRGGR